MGTGIRTIKAEMGKKESANEFYLNRFGSVQVSVPENVNAETESVHAQTRTPNTYVYASTHAHMHEDAFTVRMYLEWYCFCRRPRVHTLVLPGAAR